MRRALALVLIVAAVPALAGAADKSITLPPDHAYAELKPGRGLEATQRQCRACHSMDYIVMQPRGDAKQWQGVVAKMIKVFGAPIEPADAKAIEEYLAAAYGR